MLALVIACIVPALALAMGAGFAMHQIAQRDQRQRALETSNHLAAAVDVAFEHGLRSLQVLAGRVGPNPDQPSPSFALLLQQAGDIDGAVVALRSSNGKPITLSRSDPQASAADRPSDPSWFKLAQSTMQSRMAIVGNVWVQEKSNLAVVTLITPVFRDDTPVHFLEMQLPADQLIATLRQHILSAGGLAILIDPLQRIAAASHSVPRLVGHFFPISGLGDASPPAGLPSQYAAPEIPGIASYPTFETALHSAPGWRVVYLDEAPPSALWDPSWLIQLATIAVFLLALSLAALASRRMVAWLQQLSVLTRSMAVGSQVKIETTSCAQVGELEELRQSMLRADAVLRRRAAAERMALREARTGHELLVSVVNGTAESIHVKDLELRYVLVNRAALDNPGNSGGEPMAEWQVLGRQTVDLFPLTLARRIEAADRRVLASGSSVSFEQEYTRTGEAKTRWLAMTIAPWQDAEGRVVGVVSVSRDVTQSRQSEMRLRKLQAELLRVTRLSSMGAMASGLAHELNQPLAAATNYLNASSRLLERSTAGDEAALHSARNAVGDAAQQMLRAGSIVRRLRDFVERGEVELQPENISDLLHETCDLATTDGHADGIMLRCTIAEGIGCLLMDRTQIGQVLFNLIRNAAEAIQGVHPNPAPNELLGYIQVAARAGHDGSILIEVIDNGPGLAPGIGERLFQPFVSSKRSGMGIGLAICRTIVEGHGGTLIALPNPTSGMIFRISLPALLPQGVAP